MSRNTTRRKGFSFLSFFLGFIIGMIFLVGAIVGVGWFALNSDLDNVLSVFGVDNGKDEEGNNKVINTDEDNGGVKNALELVRKLMTMVSDPSDMSVGEVENLIPATSGIVDGIYSSLSEYVKLDRDELTSVKFSAFGEFVQDKVLDIQPAALLEGFGMGAVTENKIVEILLCGAEAVYAENGGEKYPVYYDIYVSSDGGYVREEDNEELPAEYHSSLVGKGGAYRLYYFEYSDGNRYVTDENGTFTAPVARVQNGLIYGIYAGECSHLSGNYYYNGEEKITVTPVTLRDFAEGGFDALKDVYLIELLNSPDALTRKVLGAISLGDILDGALDFDEVLRSLYISDLVNTSVTNDIMVSLIYRISEIEEVSSMPYSHKGIFNHDGNDITAYIQTTNDSDRYITRAYYISGSGEEIDIQSITVADLTDGLDLGDMMGNFTLADFVDITADNAVLMYLGYGLYDVDLAAGTGTVNIGGTERACSFTVGAGNKVTSVYYMNGSTREEVKSTGLDVIPGRIDGITEVLKIRDFVGKTDDPLLTKLGGYRIGEVSKAIDELTIGDLVDVEGNALLEMLSATTVKDLPTAIAALTVNEMYAEDIYAVKDADGNVLRAAACERATVFNPNYLYYVKDGDKFKLVQEDGCDAGKLTKSLFDAGEYYTYGEAQGMWKLLLCDDGSETAYAINNLTAMIDNVTGNMSSSKMRDLHAAGILVFTNPNELENRLPYYDNGELKYSKAIGDMELMELINFVVANLSSSAS